MTKLDQNLTDIFDVEPKTPSIIQAQELTPVTQITADNADDRDMEDDFARLRKNQEDLILKGKVALDCALDIVQQSDAPRAIEVFSTLLGQLSKINQDMMDMHMKRRDIKNGRPETENVTTTVNNNAIFVGTPAELNKMLATMTGNKPDAT